MAAPDRDVFVTVGDGSYLMMPTELVTAVQEGIKIIVVLLQNHGYASIGSLAESLGVQRFGTKYRYRSAESGRLDGGVLPVDLAANAASLGVDRLSAKPLEELSDALAKAKASDNGQSWCMSTPTCIEQSPAGDGWWDVPVADVSTIDSHPAGPGRLRQVQSSRSARYLYTAAISERHWTLECSWTHRLPRREMRGHIGRTPARQGRRRMTTITDPDALPSAPRK